MFCRFDENFTFADIYGICADDFEQEPIESSGLPVMLENMLIRNGKNTIADLLRMTPDNLARLRRVGEKSVRAAHKFCMDLQFPDGEYACSNTRKEAALRLMKSNARSIQRGDFSFVQNMRLNTELKECIEKYQRAHSDLGIALIYACDQHTESVRDIMHILQDFCHRMVIEKEFGDLFAQIPDSRKGKGVYPYICAFSQDTFTRNCLLSFYKDKERKLGEITGDLNSFYFDTLKEFLRWCLFDLRHDFDKLFERIFINEHDMEIIRLRAAGKTHKKIGQKFNISTQRASMIEREICIRFNDELRQLKILDKISAERNGKKCFGLRIVSAYVDGWKKELIYLLKRSVWWGKWNTYRILDNQIHLYENEKYQAGNIMYQIPWIR